MSLQTYTIELKLNVDDDRHEAMTQITMQYARDLMASAMLLSQGKPPAIMCRTSDAFYDTKEIEVLIPSDSIVTPE